MYIERIISGDHLQEVSPFGMRKEWRRLHNFRKKQEKRKKGKTGRLLVSRPFHIAPARRTP
jgi:hypothetical protein